MVYSGDMPYVGQPVTRKVNIVVPPVLSTFDLPPRENLLRVKPGDVVKLMFGQKGRPMERMWVKVTSVMDGQDWTGILFNTPLNIELKHGMALEFHPLTVIDIMTKEQSDEASRKQGGA